MVSMRIDPCTCAGFTPAICGTGGRATGLVGAIAVAGCEAGFDSWLVRLLATGEIGQDALAWSKAGWPREDTT